MLKIGDKRQFKYELTDFRIGEIVTIISMPKYVSCEMLKENGQHIFRHDTWVEYNTIPYYENHTKRLRACLAAWEQRTGVLEWP